MLLLVLFLVFFVVPFVLGMFDHGSEWLMRPSMYYNLYVLYVANLGYTVKLYFKSK